MGNEKGEERTITMYDDSIHVLRLPSVNSKRVFQTSDIILNFRKRRVRNIYVFRYAESPMKKNEISLANENLVS